MWGKAAAILLFAAACASARAQAPMSAEDLRTVYTELSQTYDGFVYSVNLIGYSSEDTARRTWAELQQPRVRKLTLAQVFTNVTTRTAYLFTFDPPVRQKLVTLYNHERAGPIRTARNWVIVELLETRPAPLPPMVNIDIPSLVAAGALPSAEQLRSDPALRRRSAANAVHTLDDLKQGPADLDVNQLLSDGQTLLIRSLLKPSKGLTEELLKRGADPNACAYKFCPLSLAIFRADKAMVTRLMSAGAKVDKGALDAAESAGNAEFTAWLRGIMQAKGKGKEGKP